MSTHNDLYAVMGNPITHSLSPKLHQIFAKQTHQQIAYEKLCIETDAFNEGVRAFQKRGGAGFNITVPFKTNAYELADELSEYAKRVKAVNTIICKEDGKLFGDNTDGIGLVRALKQHCQTPITDKRILLLGAGGAIQGVLAALINEKPHSVCISNRTQSKADNLIAINQTQSTHLQATSFNNIPPPPFDIIINGTSASLSAQSLDLPNTILTPSTLVYDMAYGVSQNPFLQWAKHNKATHIFDGLSMLIEQGAEAFYLWRNIRPDTTNIATELRANLT